MPACREAGGITNLVGLLGGGGARHNLRLLHAILTALLYLVSSDNNRVALYNAHGLQPLVKMVEDSDQVGTRAGA